MKYKGKSLQTRTFIYTIDIDIDWMKQKSRKEKATHKEDDPTGIKPMTS